MASIPSFRASSGGGGLGTAGSITFTIPAAVQVGDLMVAVLAHKLAVGSGTLNTPAGWTALAASTAGPANATMQGAVFARVAQIGDAGSQVVFSSTSATQQINLGFAAFVGAAISPRSFTFVNGGTTSSTTVTVPAPGVAPSTGDLVVVVAAFRGGVSGEQPTFTGTAPLTVQGQATSLSGGATNMAAFIGSANDTNGALVATSSATGWHVSGQIVLVPGSVFLGRGVSETLTMDAGAAAVVTQARPLSEAVSLADGLARVVARPRGAAEAVTVVDSLARTGALVRVVAESVALVDASSRSVARPVVTGESVTLADASARGSVAGRGVAEALSLADTLARVTTRSRGATESVTLVDGVARTAARNSGSAEQVTLSDAFPYIQARAVTGTGAITLADAATVRSTRPRVTGETVGLSSGAVAARLVFTATAEAVTLSEAVTRAINRKSGVNESAGFDVAAGATAGRSAVIGESVTLADSSGSSMVALTGWTESLTLSSSAVRAEVKYRGFAQSLTIADTVSRFVARPRGGAEAMAFSDVWASTQFAATGFVETLTLGSSASRSATSVGRPLGEAIAMGDVLARQVVRGRGAPEALILADGWLMVRSIIPVVVAEEISFSFGGSARASRARGSAEAMALTAAASRRIDRGRALNEQVVLGHLFVTTRRQLVTGSGSMTMDDQVASAVARVRAVVEQLVLDAAFYTGNSVPGQIPIVYPHRIRMTSRPATIRDTTASSATVRGEA